MTSPKGASLVSGFGTWPRFFEPGTSLCCASSAAASGFKRVVARPVQCDRRMIDKRAGVELDALLVGPVHHQQRAVPVAGYVEESAIVVVNLEWLLPLQKPEIKQALVAG